MTELPTPPEASDDTDIPLSESLVSYIVAMLAPMFLCAGSGDVRLARMAALEMLSAYRMQNQADLLAVAQIVAFGIATLGSLSQSMLDDLSLPLVLRLRSNANALSRSGQRHNQTLEQSHRAAARHPTPATEAARQVENLLRSESEAPPAPVQASVEAPPPKPQTTEPAAAAAPRAPAADTAAPPPAPAAFATAAPPFNADLTGLPPAERRPPTMRAAALGSTASTLLAVQNTPAEAPNRAAVHPREPLPTPQPPAAIPRSAPPPQ